MKKLIAGCLVALLMCPLVFSLLSPSYESSFNTRMDRAEQQFANFFIRRGMDNTTAMVTSKSFFLPWRLSTLLKINEIRKYEGEKNATR